MNKLLLIALAMFTTTGCSNNTIPEIIRDGNSVCMKEEVLKLFHDGKFFVKGESYQCIDVVFQNLHEDAPTVTFGYWHPVGLAKRETEIKKPQPTGMAFDCSGDYTMYTHPDPHCRNILAEEYKAMVKQYLETVRKSSANREE